MAQYKRKATGTLDRIAKFIVFTKTQILWTLKFRRIGWVAHIIMEERIPKKVLNGKFHNTKSLGKQRTRWEDVVRRDALQVLGMRGWRRQHRNREKCRQF
jgi:hypothetical protein